MSRCTNIATLVYNPSGGEASEVTLRGNSEVTVTTGGARDSGGNLHVATLGYGNVKVKANDQARIYVGTAEPCPRPFEKENWTSMKNWFHDMPGRNFTDLVGYLGAINVCSLSMLKEVKDSDLNNLSPTLKRSLMKFINNLKDVGTKRPESSRRSSGKCINDLDGSHQNKMSTTPQEEEAKATSSISSPSDDMNAKQDNGAESRKTESLGFKEVDFRGTIQNWFCDMPPEDLNNLVERLERRDICCLSMLKEVEESDLTGLFTIEIQRGVMELVASLKDANMNSARTSQQASNDDSSKAVEKPNKKLYVNPSPDQMSSEAQSNVQGDAASNANIKTAVENSNINISAFEEYTDESQLKATPIREGGVEAEPEETSKYRELRSFLKHEFKTLPDVKFEDLMKALNEIGVYEISDLKEVQDSDLENLLPRVQQRRLMKLVRRLREEENQERK